MYVYIYMYISIYIDIYRTERLHAAQCLGRHPRYLRPARGVLLRDHRPHHRGHPHFGHPPQGVQDLLGTFKVDAFLTLLRDRDRDHCYVIVNYVTIALTIAGFISAILLKESKTFSVRPKLVHFQS